MPCNCHWHLGRIRGDNPAYRQSVIPSSGCGLFCGGDAMTCEERFWAKVHIRGPDDCWPWLGCGDGRYGKFWSGSRQERAHRYSYQLRFGSVPNGLCVCHHCDNPRCVNPAHLFVGTMLDNMRDAASKGRMAVGVQHGRTTLNADQVREIRGSYVRWSTPLRELALRFGVSIGTIYKIVKRRTWRQVI